MHMDLYLSGAYLRKGIHVTDRTASKLPCIYAMMSEMFVLHKPLDNANIAKLYGEEILSITAWYIHVHGHMAIIPPFHLFSKLVSSVSTHNWAIPNSH